MEKRGLMLPVNGLTVKTDHLYFCGKGRALDPEVELLLELVDRAHAGIS
jgi:hypothetical protein